MNRVLDTQQNDSSGKASELQVGGARSDSRPAYQPFILFCLSRVIVSVDFIVIDELLFICPAIIGQLKENANEMKQYFSNLPTSREPAFTFLQYSYCFWYPLQF